MNADKDKAEWALRQILKGCADWYDSGENNDKAKEALMRFYFSLKKMKPDTEYVTRGHQHFSYLINLLALKKAFLDGKYMRACNELESLIHYNPFLQKRIYYNVLKLLEEELKIEE